MVNSAAMMTLLRSGFETRRRVPVSYDSACVRSRFAASIVSLGKVFCLVTKGLKCVIFFIDMIQCKADIEVESANGNRVWCSGGGRYGQVAVSSLTDFLQHQGGIHLN